MKKKEDKKQEFKMPNPSLWDRFVCGLIGHKVLKVQGNELGRLGDLPFEEDENRIQYIGITFCTRCGNLNGLPFAITKPPKELVEDLKQQSLAKKKQSVKQVVKKVKKKKPRSK